ncbi:MAG: DUF1819 family protein [Cryobacterium sp.]|nr:DUF1819 family protein [Cryobacterium sp.]
MIGAPERYRLSFSVGGLFLQGAAVAAGLYLKERDWKIVRVALDAENLLQARTKSSTERIGRELIQRLEELTTEEVALLVDATVDERAQLMWVAACRRYKLIAEFAEGVLRERFLLMAPDLTPEHFDAFVRGKTLWHPELAELEDSTLRKLRTNLFLMMREADFVTAESIIVPTVLSTRVRDEFAKREPSDIRLFPTREAA